MKEEMGITVLGALGIIAAVVVAFVLIRHLLDQQNPGPQPGPIQKPNPSELGNPS